MTMAYRMWLAPLLVSGCLSPVVEDPGFGFGPGEGTTSGDDDDGPPATTLLTTGIEPTTDESGTVEPRQTGTEGDESSGDPPDHVCGDGQVEGPETCDGALPADVTCASEGMTAGTLACDPDSCTLDLSGCTLCGDDAAEGDELCDGDDLAEETCATLGFVGGALGCAADCTFDTQACEAAAFLEDWETGSFSGDWVLAGDRNWTLVNGAPIAGTWTARSGAISANDQSTLRIDLTFPVAGTISFVHRESTEADYDALHFLIDGVEQGVWSGSNAATAQSYNVSPGAHAFEWRYSKDFSINAGADAVWIDDISTRGGGPA